jgi:hypothetical protein
MTPTSSTRCSSWVDDGPSASWCSPGRHQHRPASPTSAGLNGVWTRTPGRGRPPCRTTCPTPRSGAVWQARLDHPAWTAGPNARPLVALEAEGKLELITQNVDGLPGRRLRPAAGGRGARHREVVCMSCDERRPCSGPRPGAGRRGTRRRTCGILKSATISFGRNLVPGDIERAGERPGGRPAAGRRLDAVGLPGGRRCRGPPVGSRIVIVNGSGPRWTTWPTPSCGADQRAAARGRRPVRRPERAGAEGWRYRPVTTSLWSEASKLCLESRR